MGVTSLRLNLISVLILTAVLWRTSSADQCSLACTGSSSSQAFQNGQKYNYGIEGTVSVFLSGADNEGTSLKLLGQVSVSAAGNCVHVLQVENLAISGPKGKKYPSPPGIDKPIRFSYQDGRVGPQICAVDGDTRRSLNIKRAIISLLQTEQKSSTQTDVFGVCPTDVASSQEGGAVLVHRSRDLSRCAHREQGRNDLITAVYNPTAEIKETQVLQSILNVESKLNNGVPEKVSAIEEYLFKPFSLGENGARAKVHTKLTLTGKSGGGSVGNLCTVPRTVIFENPHGSVVPNNANSVIGAVRETAKDVSDNAGPKSAGKFSQLIRIMRASGKEDLLRAFQQVKGKDLERRVFLDGLVRAGTGYSIDASIHILKNKELGPIEQQIVFLSLGNAKHVNSDALKSAASLLDKPNLPKEIYLGVGALAGTYCREHQCHNAHNDGILALSQKLASKLQNCKPKNKIEEDNVVAVLKGIRNIRHLEDVLLDRLHKCVSDNNVKARVKVAALEAFHADPCSNKIHKLAMETMKNRQLDSEIRIKAFLAVIQCPCAHSATEIKNLLESEPVNQVGNYITATLRHIRVSSNPDKALAKQHYGQISTPNKFKIDERKYSNFREMSFNIDAIGVGGSFEQSIIYSQDSFLPRSVDFNLTTEIFGHNFNVLEFGGRQGNLDRVLENILGPKGVFRTKKPQELYDELKEVVQTVAKKTDEAIARRRRSVKSDIDNFDKNLKAETVSYNHELDLDIYIKLFGTDAVFLSLGDDKGFNFNKVLDQLSKLAVKGFNSITNLQQDLRAHILFLDAELSYPTSTGFSLRLDLVGSAATRLDVAAQVDVRQIVKNPENAKVDFKFVLSAAVEVTGELVIDADAVKTGLKVVYNTHSSTGIHVIAKVLENGRGFDLQLGLPIDKQEILTASSNLVYVTADKGQLESVVPVKIDAENNSEYTGCFDQLSGVLGLTLCGQLKLPFSVSGQETQASISSYIARSPLIGSTHMSLVLEKNDLRGYHIKGLLRGDNNGKRGFELLFDAEGSKNRRTQLTGEVVYNNQEASIQFALDSPIKVVHAQIGGYSKPNELVGLVKAKVDDQEYYAKVGFNVQGNDARSVYQPILEYRVPGEGGAIRQIKVDGQLVRATSGPQTKYTLEGIVVKLPNNEDLQMSGHVQTQSQTKEVDFNVVVKEYAYVKGHLKGNDINFEFNNKLNPFINFILNGHFEIANTGDLMHNEFDLAYGGDCKDPNSKIIFSQLLKYHTKSPQDYNIITKNKLEIRAIPFKVRFDADVDPKKLDVGLEGRYTDKTAQFDLDARTSTKKPGDYSIKLVANVDKSGLEVFAKRDITNADKSNLENYILVKNVGKYELSGVSMHRNKPNDINYGFVGYLKITDANKKHKDTKFDIGFLENQNQYSSHAKISTGNSDFLDYLLSLNKGASSNGQLKFILRDVISATGQFKVSDSDGKGNGMFILDLKKSQHKIKADLKFVNKEPVFNADFDFYLNFEKDNNDKLHFSTNNKHTDKLLDSKTKLEYRGKRTELIIHQDGFEPLGTSKTSVEMVLPSERCINLKINKEVNEKDGIYNIAEDYQLSDSPKRGSSGSTISYIGKTVDTDLENGKINYEGLLTVKLSNGKQLLESFSIKNVPQGDTFKFDFKNDLSGNLIPKPVAVVFTYNGVMSYADDKYRFNLKVGDDYAIECGGAYAAKFTEGDKKFLDDFSMVVRSPHENLRDVKYTHTFLYVQPTGQDLAEYTVIQAVQMNSDVYKIDANGKLGFNQGFGAVKLLAPHVEPVVLDVNYKNQRDGDRSKNSAELKAKYGKGKSMALAIDNAYSPHDNNLQIKINAPQNEQLKKLEINVNSKNPTPESYSSSMVIDADGRVYKTDSSIVLSKAHPVLDISYTSPSSDKVRRVYVKGTSLSSTQGKAEIKIDNVYDICLDAISEANIQKDNVALHFEANSEKLGFKNYVVDISSKDGGSGKRLEFRAVNDNKNVLSGSTSLIIKQEGQKTIIEGSGSVKVKEEQKSANFKYIRTVLSGNTEKGVETFFNFAVGELSFVAESRVTNLEYKNSYVYCEEKKQCAHAEIQSKTDTSKPGTIQNVINAGFDLRKLGVAPEFGLQIKDMISDKQLPQYTMDVHINKEDKKYHLHVFDTPEFGNCKAGISLQLPSRVVALEYGVNYPTDKSIPLPIKGELSLDMNKNRQGQKFAFRYLVDLKLNDQESSAIAEVGFFHPSIDKEAVAKIEGAVVTKEADHFRLESTASVFHPCLGSERKSQLLFDASKQNFKILIQAPFGQVLDVEASGQITDNKQQSSFKFALLDAQPILVNAELVDYKRFEIVTRESNRKLVIGGSIDPEKKVDFNAVVFIGSEKKNLVHAALFNQNNELKEEYNVDKNNFNTLYTVLKKDLDNMAERVKHAGKKADQEYENFLKHAAPTAKKAAEAFMSEAKKLSEEIANDKGLQELSHAFQEIIKYFAKIIDDVITSTQPLVDSIINTYTETYKKIVEEFNKKIEPLISQLYETVAAILKEYLDGFIEIVAHFAALGEEFFKKYSPEFKELVEIATNIFKDITKLIVGLTREFRGRIIQYYNDIALQFKDLSIVETIKEKFRELAVPDQVLVLLDELINAVKVVAPTPEAKSFLDVLNGYAQKKLRNQQCDDNKELRNLYQKLVSAFASVVQFVRSQLSIYGVQPATPMSIGSFLLSPDIFSGPPSLGDTSFSLVKQLLSGDLPDPLDLVRAYRLRSFNPLDEIPAKLRAVVVNGQHIFTFDGRHLTFPGSCRYVLAHDHVDRNFTLAIQLNNGQPKALVLEDQSGAIVEIKDNGQVTLNGAAHGYPIIEKDVYAFKEMSGRIGLGSKYGLMVFCGPKLKVCYVEVSGFYLGKLRGLLGDGNNEPYDDFRLPNGKICTSESEFGNAYKLARSCPQVQVPEHSSHQQHTKLPAACEKVFGGTSPLWPASLLVDVGPFRQACIHAVANAEDPLEQACDLGRGYGALALTGLVPAVLPDVCIQCTDTDKPRNVGDIFEIKLPTKQADVVVAIETTKSNEDTFKDLVVPLVSQLVDALKSKHLTDIKVYLVGVTSKHRYPILYDADLKLKLKNTKIAFEDEQRDDLIPTIVTGIEINGSDTVDATIKKIVDMVNSIRIGLDLTNMEEAYMALQDLTVRPTAVKHVITLVGQKCSDKFFLLRTLKASIVSMIFDHEAYTSSIVAPTEGMTVGAGKNAAHVVGYTSNAVLMLGDKKLKDSDNIRATLKIESDNCRDFTLATDGLVLSSTNFKVCNGGQQKQYLQTAVNAIVQKMTRLQRVQECTCSYVDAFSARSVCVTKEKRETARRRK